MSIKFKLGMGQMLVVGGQVDENLGRAEGMIEKAGGAGCKIVVLPECLDIGWTNPAARELAGAVPGAASERLGAAARQAGIYVAAGLTEKVEDKIYNTAVLISPGGEVLLKHRKINILDIAKDIYSTGDRLGVAQTEVGKVGLNICADNFPETLELGQSLGRMGAQTLLSPCAWAVDASYDNEKEPYGKMWNESYVKLSKLYEMSVVGVSNVGWIEAGVWKGRKCVGCSLAVGPGGEILAEGPYGVEAEELIEVGIEIVTKEDK